MPHNDSTDFDKLWDYNNPAETEKKFRELMPEAEKWKDKAAYIELLTQLARTQGLQMNFDEAHEILDKVMKLLKPEHSRARIRFMLERGRTFNSSKQYDKAEELFEAAFLQAEKFNEDYLAVDAAHMMGIVAKAGESLKWNDIAVQIAEKSGDINAKAWLGPLYNNTGWTYHDMGEYTKALELFEKNVKWHTDRNSKKELSIAWWCVARTLRSLNRQEEALKMQNEITDLNNHLGLEEDGYNMEETGECLLDINKTAESKPYFKKAYELLSQDIWVAENEKPRLQRLKELSE